MAIERVVSGGQTGVDRAALEAALAVGLAIGGWCPKARLAEDGPVPERYPLRETPSSECAERTEWNVRDSDATLVLTRGEPSGGTALTVALASNYSRPCLLLDLDLEPGAAAVAAWAVAHGVRTLNVAGPRESKSPGIHAAARRFLEAALRAARA